MEYNSPLYSNTFASIRHCLRDLAELEESFNYGVDFCILKSAFELYGRKVVLSCYVQGWLSLFPCQPLDYDAGSGLFSSLDHAPVARNHRLPDTGRFCFEPHHLQQTEHTSWACRITEQGRDALTKLLKSFQEKPTTKKTKKIVSARYNDYILYPECARDCSPSTKNSQSE